MDGNVPADRALSPSSAGGADVRPLECLPRAAGYDPDHEIAVDRSWDAGAIEPGRAVVLPGTRRVATLSTTVGRPSGTGRPVMTTTSTRPEIAVALKTTKSTVAKRRARVTVVLPSDQKVRAPHLVGRVGRHRAVLERSAGGIVGGQVRHRPRRDAQSHRPAVPHRVAAARHDWGPVGAALGAAVTAAYAASQGQPAVVHVIAGLYPSIRAARLSPTEALRTA